jgi:hypothetical protein
VFRQIAVLALVAVLADGGWFVVGRLFPLIECFQRVASRKISVSGLFPRQRGARGWPSNDVPFPSWPGPSRPSTWFGSSPIPGLRPPRWPISPGRRFQFCIERNQSFGRLFLQQRALVILAARQTESRAVRRAPVYHILWVRGFRAPTPGFNLFKPLRRHFPATPFCRQPLARDPSDRNASVQKVDHRLGGLRWDGGARPESI